jgi:hypothetical protein
MKLGLLVVWVGPRTILPRASTKLERDLRVDPLRQIEPMGMVLGRGQDELVFGQISRIEI